MKKTLTILLLILCLIGGTCFAMAGELPALPTIDISTDAPDPTEDPAEPTEEPTDEPTEEPTETPTEEPTDPPYDYRPLKLRASANPNTLAEPGRATVSVSILNDGDSPVDEITVTDENGHTMGSVRDLGEGEEETVTDEVDISQAMLDRGETVITVNWSQGAGVGSVTVNAAISLLQPEPEIEFRRSSSLEIAKEGQEVTLTYTLRNTGNVPLVNLEITDQNIMGGQSITIDRVDVGDRATELYTFVMGNASVISKPRVDYELETGEKDYETLRELTIGVANTDISVTLRTDTEAVAPGGQVNLQLILENRGNVEYNSINAVDAANMLERSDTDPLRPGKSLMLSFTVMPTQTTSYQFEVTARDSTDEARTLNSNTVTVQVDSDIFLTLSARLETELQEPGEATFLLTLHNESPQPLQNVELSEKNIGALGEDFRLATLSTGESTFRYTTNIAAPDTYRFFASVGNGSVIVEAPDLTVSFGAVTTPLPSDPAAMPPAEDDGWMNTLFIIVGVVILLIVGVIAALIIMGIRDRRAQEGYYGDAASGKAVSGKNAPRKSYRDRDDDFDDTKPVDVRAVHQGYYEDNADYAPDPGRNYSERSYSEDMFKPPAPTAGTVRITEDDYPEDDYSEDDYPEDDYPEDEYPADDYPEDEYPDDGADRPSVSRAERRRRRRG